MANRVRDSWLSRLLPIWVGLCYLVLSLALPFQHKDHWGEEAQVLLRASASAPQARESIPVATHLTACAKVARPNHCLACEWQAVNTSPALPVFQTDFVPPTTPRVLTVLPRYLRSRSLPTSSRGPPLV